VVPPFEVTRSRSVAGASLDRAASSAEPRKVAIASRRAAVVLAPRLRDHELSRLYFRCPFVFRYSRMMLIILALRGFAAATSSQILLAASCISAMSFSGR